MAEYLGNLFSKYQSRFQWNFDAQKFLTSMIEKIKNIWDKRGPFTTNPTYLSKVFDYNLTCIPVS